MSSEKPEVSVVMAAYNAEPYIAESIKSILTQTLSNFEFIIVNDGSSDNTGKVIDSFSDSRIRAVRLEHNVGVSSARNHATPLVRSEFIAIMDADDIARPERLARQLKYLREHPWIGAAGSEFLVIDQSGKVVGQSSAVRSPAGETKNLALALCMTNPVLHPTTMFRREVLERVPYRDGLIIAHDLDVILRMYWLGYQTDNITENLTLYRIHCSQLTDSKKRWRAQEEHLQIIKDICDAYISEKITSESIRHYSEFFHFWHPDDSISSADELLIVFDRIAESYKKLFPKIGTEQRIEEARLFAKSLIPKEPALLEAYFRELLKNVNRKGIPPALYGAGKHTEWLIPRMKRNNIPILCVFDDAPKVSDIYGVPVHNTSEIPNWELDAVVVSSDTMHKKMAARLKSLPGCEAFSIVDPYEKLPLAPFAKS